MTALVLTLSAAAQTPPQRPASLVRDSVPEDSLRGDRARRLPVTPEVLATAFSDATARALFYRARAMYAAQDSAITSYDADVVQRMSVLAAIGKIGRPRLAFRRESVARVRWQRGAGAHIQLKGARFEVPLFGSKEFDKKSLETEALEPDMSPIPYFPGSEGLWIGGTVARTDVDERSIVSPLAAGAEAYYRYRTGDAASFRLPDGREITIRELEVRPREPRFNLTVGSLWFDAESGHLVRAAYRLAAPAAAAVSVESGDSTRKGRIATAILTSLIQPSRAEISSVVVEYGLFEGRFWLPRLQSMEGYLDAMFAHVPMRYENAFRYTAVNGPMELAAIHVDTTRPERPQLERPPAGLSDSARRRWRDSARTVYESAMKRRSDSIKAGMKVGSLRQCDSSAVRFVTLYRTESRIPVRIEVPCELDKLINSPDLPSVVADSGEDVFNSEDRDRLVAMALGMAAQAPFAFGAFPRPQLRLGPSMTRYNRVEGFATGLGVDQQLGAGLSVGGLVRYGFADRALSGEASFARSNARRSLQVGAYERLVAAGDWGRPLSFGASMSALFFGLDEGFYYRTTGAELTWTRNYGAPFTWRAFAERQRAAAPNASFSVGGSFGPNIAADAGAYTGLSVRTSRAFGLDPHGWRLFLDTRLEGARGDSTYGRGAFDVTLSRELSRTVAASVLVSGGSSVGGVPPQRHWYLGGTHTVRGLSPDTAQHGNAFWLGRLELARQMIGARIVLFGDIGWAGSRDSLSAVGRPLSGVGIGVSGFDGLIRLDVGRGLHPTRKVRVALYLDARF